MSLHVQVEHQLGAFHLTAEFESSGRLTALFGSSGSGKTTLINIIAGLLQPKAGRIDVDGRVLLDTARRISVAPHKRRIGYVFQESRLFPHLSVSQNLRYGSFFAPPAERSADFGKVVELLGIARLLDRRPSGLSGGEKQRVAIGRALLSSPRLLLMDEPLASLDEARKMEILPYLERVRDEGRTPIVYVSHSVAEVTRLATDVVLLSGGKAAAVGPMPEIMGRLDAIPDDQRSEGGALIEALIARHDGGLTVLQSAAGEWQLPRIELPLRTRLRFRVRARDVMIAIERPRGISALNVLPGKVVSVAGWTSQDVVVSLDCSGETLLALITRHSADTLGLAQGAHVFAVVKAVALDRQSIQTAPSPSWN